MGATLIQLHLFSNYLHCIRCLAMYSESSCTELQRAAGFDSTTIHNLVTGVFVSGAALAPTFVTSHREATSAVELPPEQLEVGI